MVFVASAGDELSAAAAAAAAVRAPLGPGGRIVRWYRDGSNNCSTSNKATPPENTLRRPKLKTQVYVQPRVVQHLCRHGVHGQGEPPVRLVWPASPVRRERETSATLHCSVRTAERSKVEMRCILEKTRRNATECASCLAADTLRKARGVQARPISATSDDMETRRRNEVYMHMQQLTLLSRKVVDYKWSVCTGTAQRGEAPKAKHFVCV